MEKIYTIKDEKADCNKCDYCDDDSAYYCIKRCGEEKHWKKQAIKAIIFAGAIWMFIICALIHDIFFS